MNAKIFALGLTLIAHAAVARASDRFVSLAGSDAGNDCASATAPCRSITHALGQAASGDAVEVAGGVYRESPTVSGTFVVTISGGWAPDFSSRDIQRHVTAVTKENVVLSAGASAGESLDVTFDGLRFAKTPVIIEGSADAALHVTVLDSTFSGLGGLYALHQGSGTVDLSVTGTTFTGNKRPDGALVVFGASGPCNMNVDVHTSTFAHNQFGAIIFQVDLASAGTLTVDRSSFVANKGREGGAIMVAGAGGALTATISNSFMARNATTHGALASLEAYPLRYGGAVAVDGNAATTVHLVNDTIVENHRARGGGGLLVNGSATVDLENVILWNNRPDDVLADTQDLMAPGPVVNLDHDDIGVIAPSPHATLNDLGGNLQVDPLLGKTVALPSGSPMIDAGTCAGAPPEDIDGDPRPTGPGCDIGADEFVP